MKFLLLLLTIVATMFAGALPAKSAEKDGVLIHVSHGADSPQRVVMALRMANTMAEDHDVLIYFDIDAINVVLADSKDVISPQFESSKAQLDALRAKNVILLACPDCLKAAGKTEKDLALGVKLANKDQMLSFTRGRILTLDY